MAKRLILVLCALYLELCTWCFVDSNTHSTTKHKAQSTNSLLLSLSFCQLHQLLRHPLAHGLCLCFLNANRSIMPTIPRAFPSSLSFVVFCLLETENNAVGNFVPILKLYSASDYRQSCRPVFLGRSRILLRYSQIIEWRKGLPGKFFY